MRTSKLFHLHHSDSRECVGDGRGDAAGVHQQEAEIFEPATDLPHKLLQQRPPLLLGGTVLVTSVSALTSSWLLIVRKSDVKE